MSTSFRATWIVPIDQPPIANGIVTVADGKVISLESDPRNVAGDLVELEDSAIVPGLVNAHTHLEFSHLGQPLGQPGIAFTDWIRLIIESRTAANQVVGTKSERIRAGLKELTASGTCAVGEIASSPVELGDYEHDPHALSIRTVVFHEQLSRQSSQFARLKRERMKFLESRKNLRATLGLSPHAPYSVHPELLRSICQTASQRNLPLAMHLAESRAERELLESRTGPFVGLLTELAVWDESTFLPPVSIEQILRQLATCPRSLIIHGNYLTESETAVISAHRDLMSVVYCPRTHQYFRHAAYPLNRFRDAGINVAIGTDSRASNPDLRMLEELKQVRRSHPSLSATEILELGTINGARALGLPSLGRIRPGVDGCLGVIHPVSRDSLDSVFEPATTCRQLAVPA